jgi:hypothetical protein
MQMKNKALQTIYDNAVAPAIRQVRYNVEGHIMSVDYYRQTVDVLWYETGGQEEKHFKDIPIPRESDGVFKQSLKIGDKVSVGFRNGQPHLPYIAIVYKSNVMKEDYRSKFGAGIPKGMGYY